MTFNVMVSKVSEDNRLSGIITCPGYKPMDFFIQQGQDVEQGIRELIALTTDLPLHAIGIRFVSSGK